jgi:short-subunit dehydrogenase
VKLNNALILGGGRGIGLAVVKQLLKKEYDNIYIVGLHSPEDIEIRSSSKIKFIKANFINEDLSFLNKIEPINFLFISVGFGRVAKFLDLKEAEISNIIKVNQLIITRVLHYYFPQISSDKDFFCGVMVSVSGLLSSPLFSVYGSTKAALAKLIESLNIELLKEDSKNRILDVSPGHIEGTSFYGKETEVESLNDLANNILEKMYTRESLYIPNYDETYRDVLAKYIDNPLEFGIDSYNYKEKSKRISTKAQLKVGYLSGTFAIRNYF